MSSPRTHQPVPVSDIELEHVAPLERPRSGRMERVGDALREAQQQASAIATEAKGDCCFTCLNCCSLEERANHQRKLIFHRTSPLSFWFALLVLCVGAIVGLFVKRLAADGLSNIKDTVKNSVSDASSFNENTINFNDFLYWMTYFCWSGRWYVQALLNFTRGRTIGLSINYVMWAMLGEVCHLLSVLVAQYSNRTIASFDSRDAVIDAKMTIYALNGVFAPMLVALQCWRYDGWNNQTPSALVRGTFILAVVFTVFYMIINMAMLKDTDSSVMAIDRWVYAAEIMSIICSVICFVPQFNLHRYYKVVIGVDILHLLLQLLGALCLFCLIFISLLKENDFQFGSLSTFREVVTVEIRQVIQSLLIIIAVMVLYTQFCFYWKMPTLADIEKKANVPSRNAPLQHIVYTEQERRASIGADPRSRSAMQAEAQRQQEQQRQAQQDPRSRSAMQQQQQQQQQAIIRVGGPRPSSPNDGDAVRRVSIGSDPRGRSQGMAQQHTARPVSVTRRAPTTAPESEEEREQARLVAQSAASLPGWKCPVCTYDNAGVQLYCLLCETPFEDVVDQIQASPRQHV